MSRGWQSFTKSVFRGKVALYTQQTYVGVGLELGLWLGVEVGFDRYAM